MSALAALSVLLAMVPVTSLPIFEARLNSTATVAGPFFYITFHEDVSNVMKYTMDGKSLGPVLTGKEASELDELRSMALYDGMLYLANAKSSESMIAVFGQCGSDGMRSFHSTLATIDKDEYLDHPYGIAFDNDGNVYVSNQHSDRLTRYHALSSASPGEALKPSPVAKVSSNQGCRGVEFDHTAGHVFVADEDGDVVHEMTTGGATVHDISVSSPIDLFFDASARRLYIGSKDKKRPAVYAYDVDGRKIVQTFEGTFTHPAGITVYAGTLYVVCQDRRELQSFDMATGLFKATVISKADFPNDDPEDIIVSPC